MDEEEAKTGNEERACSLQMKGQAPCSSRASSVTAIWGSLLVIFLSGKQARKSLQWITCHRLLCSKFTVCSRHRLCKHHENVLVIYPGYLNAKDHREAFPDGPSFTVFAESVSGANRFPPSAAPPASPLMHHFSKYRLYSVRYWVMLLTCLMSLTVSP